MSTLLDIANAPSASTTFWSRGSITWESIERWVDAPRSDGGKDGPGYVLGHLSCARRTKETVDSRGVIALDADHLTPATRDELMSRLHALGCAAVVYSTFSNTAAAPKLRILILPDRSLSPEEYWLAAKWLMHLLGNALFDERSPQHERLMYMPTAAPGQPFFSEVLKGPPLNVDDALAAEAMVLSTAPRPEKGEATTPEQHAPDRPVPEDVVQDQVSSAIRGLDALAELPVKGRHPWPGVPEGLGWDLGPLYMAERLIQAANSGVGYTIEQAQADFMEHAPASEGSYDREYKWGQAVKYVGTQPMPYEHPDEVFDPETGQAKPEKMDKDVLAELHKLRVRHAAQEAFRSENEPSAPPFDSGTLGEILARPPEPPMRIDGLVPWDASTLLVAMRKTGKTTLTLNLARSLLTGRDFLGKFAVLPVSGIVGILNYEVSGATLARWAEEHGLDHRRFYMVNLRGRRNPLSHAQDRALLAARLRGRGVESLIVDPFGRAYTGVNQNDPGEVGTFLSDLDAFARTDVGARDLILTAHAGWVAEHSRGSSTIEDWPDSIITMTRDPKDQDIRFLSAMGRDIDMEEDRLDFDRPTRTLSLSGAGSRKRIKAVKEDAETKDDILDVLRANPGGLTGHHLGLNLDRRDAAFTVVRNGLVDDGLVIRAARTGKGGGFLYLLNTAPAPNIRPENIQP